MVMTCSCMTHLRRGTRKLPLSRRCQRRWTVLMLWISYDWRYPPSRLVRGFSVVPQRNYKRHSSYVSPKFYHTSLAARKEAQEEVLVSSHYHTLPRLYVGRLEESPRILQPGSSLLNQLANATVSNEHSILAPDAVVSLSPDQSHYLTSVLRLHKKKSRNHHQVRLFDGLGSEWLAEVILSDSVSNRRNRRSSSLVAQCIQPLLPQSCCPAPSNLPWLCVAAPKKKDRLRWLVEKTTELQVGGYLWLDTDHSETMELSFAKLRAYAVEATEQCERRSLPQFVRVGHDETAEKKEDVLLQERRRNPLQSTPFSSFLQLWSRHPDGVQLLVCRERSSSLPLWQAMEQRNDDTTTIAFLIGPEGGWSEAEETLLDELKEQFPDRFVNVSLGPTVLRAETAAMTAVAAYTLHQDAKRNRKGV